MSHTYYSSQLINTEKNSSFRVLYGEPIEQMSTPLAERGARVDWGDALDVPTFYGREKLPVLSGWLVQ